MSNKSNDRRTMGHAYKRIGIDGKPRYSAIYFDARGRRRSAGTFSSKRRADTAWQRAEAKVAEGRLGNPQRGKVDFRTYVSGTWLPNHQLEITTRQRYVYSIDKHLMPEFGAMRMIDILPAHVREWIVRMTDAGASPSTITDNKTILSAIFTTALNDQVIHIHPCRGVKTPTVPRKPRTIVTPEQFDTIYCTLPDDTSRLLIETAIESGLRWGELAELRARDIDTSSRMLTVSRAVVEVNAPHRTDENRFEVKQYPKDKEYRRLKLSAELVQKIQRHMVDRNIDRNGLLFPMAEDAPQTSLPPVVLETLARTEPNAAGRTYTHGTLTAYSLGRCRCAHCKNAYATYRAERRASGIDSPRGRRTVATDGHIPRRWFHQHIWRPATNAAGLDFNVRVHDLRHAHASWLLAGGADLQAVKERLGHGSLRTTEKYLHTLPDSDEAAINAFQRIRNR